MPLRVKICGLTTAEAVDAAVRHGAGDIGFVFFPKSPRDIAPERAGGLPSPDHVGRIGVFVDPDDDLLLHAVAAARLTGVQLHGSETPERVAAVSRRLGVETWKAVPVRARADLDLAARYRGAADRILYDAKPPAGADLPGGMGMRFDWRLLAHGPEGAFRHPLPWLLSGGIDAGNLAEAIAITGARTIDVSSGVEDAPGAKSVDKIAAFLQAAARL